MKTRFIVVLLLLGIVLLSGCAKEKTEPGALPDETSPPATEVPTKTASDCEKITTETERDSCYEEVAASTGDSSLCEQISRESMKNICFLTIAMDTKNIALCDKVTVDNVRFTDEEDCSSVVAAVSAEDYSRCEQISSSILRSDCCEKVAMDTKDAALCDDATDKDYCYRIMAVATSKSSLCEQIDVVLMKSRCYSQVAVHTGNADLCYKITDPRTKNNCIDLFREYLD